MTTKTMSPHIQKLLDEILDSFSLREPHFSRTAKSTRSCGCGGREELQRDLGREDVQSAPTKAFVNSVRKRARAS